MVFNAIGDTTNMMLARLVPQGNEIILLNNGFVNLDKYITFEIPGPKSQWYLPLFGVRTGKRYQLDLAQGEFHTIAKYWPKLLQGPLRHPAGAARAPESWFAKHLPARGLSREVPGDLPTGRHPRQRGVRQPGTATG